jgi:hypothetical protein
MQEILALPILEEHGDVSGPTFHDKVPLASRASLPAIPDYSQVDRGLHRFLCLFIVMRAATVLDQQD